MPVPDINYIEKGGIWLSYGVGTLGATWPFAVIKLTSDNIQIKLDFTGTLAKVYFPFFLMGKLFNLNKEYIIDLKEIDFVERKLYFPFFADGIRIHHHGNAPKYILFWSLKSAHLLQLLEKQGVPTR